ncbi:MAG: response regulator, partial [Deltaproteobacteria bacterium]|nr:response regulator [Deltaproteobacteria bacterium]
MDLLRTAARGGEKRFLVGILDDAERERICRTLAGEGAIVEIGSTEQALVRLADESFDLAFLTAEPAGGGSLDTQARDPLAAWRELRPFTDLVLVAPGDPVRCAEAFGREVAAVFPIPLPEVDVLLRAHVKRLVASRQLRTRGLLVLNAFSGIRDILSVTDPDLTTALVALLAASKAEPGIAVMGDSDLARHLGGTAALAAPDAVVVGLGTDVSLDHALQEARDRMPGAALIVVDASPTVDRLRAAIYGGVRAYLPRAQVALLGRVAASVASRRHAEMVGLDLAEALPLFGIVTGRGGPVGDPNASNDLDIRLIADAKSAKPTTPIIPTGHEVLVVDDEAVVLTVLREALRRGGYRVTTAASAEEAIDLMQKRRFDLVLTDKNLPGASGMEVLRVARSLNPAPAVVMITGYSSLDSAVEALDMGALDYIEKPIHDVEDLRMRIRRALTRRDELLARPRVAPAGRSGRVLLVEAEGARRQLIAEYLGR